MKLVLLSLAAVLTLCGCSAAGHAVGTALRPLGPLVNIASGPVRGATN